MMQSKEPLRVLITGATGRVGYCLVYQIAAGCAFGSKQPVDLVLFDSSTDVMEGVIMELQDCNLPLLRSVTAARDEAEAFGRIDAAFLVGAKPRRPGMERKDLLAANCITFKRQGMALANYSKSDVKVLVVGNPANTNAFICAKYASVAIPARNISALTRLDHNRAKAELAAHLEVKPDQIRQVTIWGNHSSTQFPDVQHAKLINFNTSVADAFNERNDQAWLKDEFIPTIQCRGAAIMKKRKLSSAMSAAKAACDHMFDWFNGTTEDWVSMAVASDGSYGIPQGTFYSFPVRIDKNTRDWHIVQNLPIDEWARAKMDASLAELLEEQEEALAALQVTRKRSVSALRNCSSSYYPGMINKSSRVYFRLMSNRINEISTGPSKYSYANDLQYC